MMSNAKCFLYRQHMSDVLFDWIAQLIPIPMDVLCPIFRIFTAINITGVVLCLYDKNTIHGNHNMVNLD